MTFTLLPAVDVSQGQAVRLDKGEAGTETCMVPRAMPHKSGSPRVRTGCILWIWMRPSAGAPTTKKWR